MEGNVLRRYDFRFVSINQTVINANYLPVIEDVPAIGILFDMPGPKDADLVDVA